MAAGSATEVVVRKEFIDRSLSGTGTLYLLKALAWGNVFGLSQALGAWVRQGRGQRPRRPAPRRGAQISPLPRPPGARRHRRTPRRSPRPFRHARLPSRASRAHVGRRWDIGPTPPPPPPPPPTAGSSYFEQVATAKKAGAAPNLSLVKAQFWAKSKLFVPSAVA
jgi:hypothetical protein